MLKDENKENFESESHFTYREYKKKVKKDSHKDITVFISVFVIGVLIILGFAKILSPNVDVSISDEANLAAESFDDDEEYASSVDKRLKRLQLEDEGREEGDEMFTPNLDEKVVLPKEAEKKAQEVVERVAKTTEQTPQQEPVAKTPATTVPPAQTQTPAHTTPSPATVQASTPTVNAKVVVGYYATEQQAEVAKSILLDSGLGISPVIKHLGGYYTLQIGSYTSKERAQQVANNLIKNNYPARVILE